MKSTMAMLAALSALAGVNVGAAGDLPLSWRGQPGSTYQEWGFETSSSPAVPDKSRNVVGGQASIVTGPFSLGWQNQLPGLGDAIGYWDLGRSGHITVSTPATAAAAPAARYVYVQVSQWIDGAIYSDYAAVSVPNATSVGVTGSVLEFGAVGGWVVNQTLWRLEAGASAESISIAGAFNGSVIDQVIVESGSTVVSAPALSIRPLAGAGRLVEISWADGADYLLEGASTLGAPSSWAPVEAPVVVSGSNYSVRLEASDAVRFFRLKKP